MVSLESPFIVVNSTVTGESAQNEASASVVPKVCIFEDRSVLQFRAPIRGNFAGAGGGNPNADPARSRALIIVDAYSLDPFVKDAEGQELIWLHIWQGGPSSDPTGGVPLLNNWIQTNTEFTINTATTYPIGFSIAPDDLRDCIEAGRLIDWTDFFTEPLAQFRMPAAASTRSFEQLPVSEQDLCDGSVGLIYGLGTQLIFDEDELPSEEFYDGNTYHFGVDFFAPEGSIKVYPNVKTAKWGIYQWIDLLS